MSWRRLLPLLLVATVACFDSGKDDDDDDDDDDDGDDTAVWADDRGWTGGDDTGGHTDDCPTEWAPAVPNAGQSDAYYRSAIEVMLTNGEGDETLTLATVSGSNVPGTVTNDGVTLTFTPDSTLSPSTAYEVEVLTCQGTGTYTFETSDAGTPTSCDPTDEAWVLDLQGARFIEPAGTAELLLGQLEDAWIVGLTRASGSSATLVLGPAAGSSQDECAPTTTLTGTWSDPHVSVGAADVNVTVEGLEFPVNDLELSGDVSSDCRSFEGGVLSMAMDIRVYAPMMGDLLGITDPDEIRATLTGFGVSCVACPDGQDYCVPFLVDQIEGSTTGAPIEVRSEADILADSNCDGVSGGCTSAPAPRGPTPWLPLAMLPGVALVAFRRRS